MITKSDITDKTLQALENIIGYKPTLGTMLRTMRECEDMSLTEFAKILKITPQKLCDIEKGRRIISPKIAAEFARLLDDSPDFFVVQCLQDELDRYKINVSLDVKHKPAALFTKKLRTHTK
jgi:plasmid maintenance system antidote protein VapI